MRPFGIYIHIPFCDGKCAYCNFYSVRRGAESMDEYTEKLKERVARWGADISRKVTSVYFGGGTPSLLGGVRLSGILNTVKESFDISDDAEITLEANPASVSAADFAALRAGGFNRLSIGIQSANDNELKILGRRHTAADAAAAVKAAREAGFDNISLDIMLAIPEQTPDSLDRTIDFSAYLDVEHVSAYILKVEKGTAFYRGRDTLGLFSEDEQAEIYEHTVRRLAELGYRQYEISNFCKEGRESRHNLLYWHDEEYLGIGPSAHSFIDGKRFYYPDSIDKFYMDEICEEGFGGDKEEYVMLALRLSEGLIFDRYRERFGSEVSERIMMNAGMLQRAGLVEITPCSLSLTVKGFLVSNSVIAYLLQNT